MFHFLADLIFPKVCVGCGSRGTYLCCECEKAIQGYTLPLCPSCMKQIARLGTHPGCRKSTHLDGLIAAGKHTGILRNLVHHIKYLGHADMAQVAARLISQKIPRDLLGQDFVVTSVPIHPSRERQRGYNQSALLGKTLAKMTGSSYWPLLKKVRNTVPQAKLAREQRLKNLRSAFVSRKLKPGVKILLVDDVSTTGATLDECAKELKRSGAGLVYGVVLAHGK